MRSDTRVRSDSSESDHCDFVVFNTTFSRDGLWLRDHSRPYAFAPSHDIRRNISTPEGALTSRRLPMTERLAGDTPYSIRDCSRIETIYTSIYSQHSDVKEPVPNPFARAQGVPHSCAAFRASSPSCLFAFRAVVEQRGIEPLTLALQTRCSPTELLPH